MKRGGGLHPARPDEVLETIFEARPMVVFCIKSFVLSIGDCSIVFKPALSLCSPSLLLMF